jgi:hypothetical protein
MEKIKAEVNRNAYDQQFQIQATQVNTELNQFIEF